MGLFSALTSIISTALPKILNIVKYAGTGIAQGIAENGLAGYRLQLEGQRAGSEFKVSGLDGTITEDESAQEQVLQQHIGANKTDVVAGLIAQREMANGLLLGALVNCRQDEVTLEATPSFYYSLTAKSGEKKNGVPVIGVDDHAYTHLIPKLFRNYDRLKQYDAFRLDAIEVTSTQMTTSITGTTVSFFPLSADTRNYSNAFIKSAYNSQSASAYGGVAYMIRNVSPATYTITKDSFVPDTFEISPNVAIRTSFLDKYDAIDTDSDGTFFSYGTLCFVKENLSETDVAMQFSVKLHFRVWSQQYLTKDEGKEDDDSSDDGQEPGNTPGASCFVFRSEKIAEPVEPESSDKTVDEENKEENIENAAENAETSTSAASRFPASNCLKKRRLNKK